MALTSLNVCPDATLIATATTTGVPTAQITTATPPLFPFEVGEPIDINGVSVGTGGLVGAGYNGLGVYQISAVISPTTFQYRAFGGTTPVLGLPDGVGGGVTALLTVDGTAVPGAGACSTASGASGLGNVATFPVDTGTRFIELGWSGDGAPNDDTLFTPAGTKDFRCKEAVDAANANPANLTSVLSAFAMGAVRHHFAITNARVPGVDFRCPTDNELQEIYCFPGVPGPPIPIRNPVRTRAQGGDELPWDTSERFAAGDHFQRQHCGVGQNHLPRSERRL
ncbi:MAG TPA: hypothetical protein VEJ86_12210 [Candidatus Binataceae bacterium]|nr:hypothetical protein [Candidatus Binataceae bacterium]